VYVFSGEDHNVSWEDAVAYTQWLSKRTGMKYRLPFEAKWKYAARATTTTSHYWPENMESEQEVACDYANVFNTKNEAQIENRNTISWDPFKYKDEYPFTAPVGKFKSNNWKLHDMLGNVWEWTQDCDIDTNKNKSSPTYGLPQQTSKNGDCTFRVVRGSSWLNVPQLGISSFHDWFTPDFRNSFVGFRLARTR